MTSAKMLYKLLRLVRLVAGGVVKSAARVEGGSATSFSNVMERVAA